MSNYNSNLYFVGDTHGALPNASRSVPTGFGSIYEWNKMVTDSVIIHLGDFGYGETYNHAAKLGKRLKSRGNKMYVLRGNHCNPLWFKENRVLDNLMFCPDYSIVEFEGKKIGLIGGGISIDRAYRTFDPKKHGQYFWGEEIVPPTENNFKNFRDIDILATHVGPVYAAGLTFPSPNIIHYAEKDAKLLNDLINEQKLVEEIFQKVKNPKLKRWYFGHFHVSNVAEKEGVVLRATGCCEIVQYTL